MKLSKLAIILAFAALVSACDARHAGGEWLLRIEE